MIPLDADCLARLVGVAAAQVPPPVERRSWLSERGLGLVEVAGAPGFAWPGPFAARIAEEGEERDVVMFGVPPGVLFDPRNRLPTGATASVRAAWLLAALDPAEPPLAVAVADFDAGEGIVEAILIAPAAEALMRPAARVAAIADRGLRGDRYAGGLGTFSDPGVPGHDLTLVEGEVLEELGLSAGDARRNLVTRGVRLDALIGRAFSVGEVVCAGRRRCEPCAHLQRVTGRAGILRELVHRGGLRADILKGGAIALGDRVSGSSHATPPARLSS